MKIKKSHFEFHDRVRNGILLFAVLLLGIIVFTWNYPFTTSQKSVFSENIVYQAKVDSLKRILERKQKEKIILKPFNPNFINDYRGDQLGISAEALDKVYQYRKQEKWINSAEQFQLVTGVSDSLLQKIKPYFKFPEWKTDYAAVKNKNRTVHNLPFHKKGDLNKVTALQLQEEIGIPDFVAEKIITYREEIGGFRDAIQLQDIPSLYTKQRKKLNSLYNVKNKNNLNYINIKEASVKELLSVPYFDFEMALAIHDFILQFPNFSKIEELKEIEGFPFEKIDRIALYLK
ncbi:helix-hairpin-helix domain-containing protein [Aquimarina sp. ERC-38]|uniref:helix-hairpin-helix domain-containing protein n=1 Tax=Aquimarina sp. ERC-38 TaxID=2949996 RepID=UPI002245427A|nr:helix-hairpin-helix domain-containing protein [Aquimarina sp. ERC-38]UZO79392.1 helix-hairpin-helix domain-containing protein [Aquimarina sp. ERC-38]